MNYVERAQRVANAYRLSVVDPHRKTLDLVELLADEFKSVAREARKKLRQDLKEKAIEDSAS